MQRDIIVIGASAGGLAALKQVIAGLPPKLAVSIFVVVHMPPWHRSELPQILSRESDFTAVHPEHSQLIEPGYIYVAPPDFHLLIESSRVQLWRGPKENRQRPSVNVLFRSAAVAYGPRVIGVILSGTLDDGATGLWWVKKHGGVAVVQTPSDAEFDGMPITALEHVDVNEVIPAREIGASLADLATERAEIEVTRNRARGEGAKWKRSS